jgi:hypothetical protein
MIGQGRNVGLDQFTSHHLTVPSGESKNTKVVKSRLNSANGQYNIMWLHVNHFLNSQSNDAKLHCHINMLGLLPILWYMLVAFEENL